MGHTPTPGYAFVAVAARQTIVGTGIARAGVGVPTAAGIGVFAWRRAASTRQPKGPAVAGTLIGLGPAAGWFIAGMALISTEVNYLNEVTQHVR